MIFIILVPLVNCSEYFHEDTAENRLYSYLFNTGYNKHIRPIEDPNQAINVTMRFELSHIQKIDDREEVLYTSGFIAAKWHDSFLTWDPKNFSNAENFIIDAHTVWLPDFAVMNSVGHVYDSSYKHDFKVHIHYTGMVLCFHQTLVMIQKIVLNSTSI